jgi:hypothetical protein
MISTILQSEQRRRIWLYFLDPRIRYALLVLFLGLVLVEVSLGKGLVFLGLAWLGGALALDRTRPSDQELDELCSRDVKALVEKAMQGCEPQVHEMRAMPLALSGPIDLDARAYYRFFTRPRTGKDGSRRSPINRVVILLPMEDHLGIYSCHHDSLRDLTSQVSVEEHHYRDVVSVILEEDVGTTDGRAFKDGGCLATQVFSLEFTNGRRLSVPVSVGTQGEGAEAGSRRTGLDKTVRAIQTLLRDKR